MRVLLVKPGEFPRAVDIKEDLASMQAAVGGCIEAIYPFEEPVRAKVEHVSGVVKRLFGYRKTHDLTLFSHGH